MFKKADKKFLMSPKDYEVFQQLPDKFVVYRGVAVGRNPNGLSWTQNLETAKWFAQRFNFKDKEGYIQTAIISKDKVLAYFNIRNEDEIVCKVPKKDIKILKKD